MMRLPAPVIVSVFPAMLPVPVELASIVNVTVSPEVDVAESVTGATPNVTGEIGAVKLIVCAALLTTIVRCTSVAVR